jgi:uncharacterized protein (TIGR00730 family)
MERRTLRKPFPSAVQDAEAAKLCPATPQTQSDSYRLAYADLEFMLRDELRPVRLQLELLKPELVQQEHGIEATVVVFGSARVPDPETARQRLVAAEAEAQQQPSDTQADRRLALARKAVANARYYEEARKFARLISQICQGADDCRLVVITGGGPGIMEAANRGAYDAGAKNVGLNIVLPFEQAPNPYVTPELSFQFHYFAIRKMHFLIRARALVAFPGGFGTLDELTDTLTLVQTKKIAPVPVILFGKEFWDRVIRFEALAEEGMISYEDLELIQFVETAEEAVEIIARCNGSEGSGAAD